MAHEVRLSSADRVLFPEDGVTKGDLFAYYERIAAVLDVLTPGISGDAAVERLLQVNPDLPVILMTGSSEFAEASGMPVRRKPFPQDEIAAVRSLAPAKSLIDT